MDVSSLFSFSYACDMDLKKSFRLGCLHISANTKNSFQKAIVTGRYTWGVKLVVGCHKNTI
jgi:hypothetical protein